MPFGHLVIGPPGSGKTTYCEAMRRHLAARGRDVAVVNLDPANDSPLRAADVDVRALVSADAVAEALGLGPNGAMVYCLEHLLANADWLTDRLRRPAGPDGRSTFFLIDCPGQIELYTHHEGVRRLVDTLSSALDLRLVAVHLMDAHHCLEVSKYVAGLVVSLSAMLHLELPHVNVLSKVDTLGAAGPLAFPLSFYTDCHDLSRLAEVVDDAPAFGEAHARLTHALCDVVEDYGLLHFVPMCAEDEETVARVCAAADKACGYAFNADEGDNTGILGTVAGPSGWEYDRVNAVEDRYLRRELEGDPDALAKLYREGLGEEEGEEGEEGGGDGAVEER